MPVFWASVGPFSALQVVFVPSRPVGEPEMPPPRRQKSPGPVAAPLFRAGRAVLGPRSASKPPVSAGYVHQKRASGGGRALWEMPVFSRHRSGGRCAMTHSILAHWRAFVNYPTRHNHRSSPGGPGPPILRIGSARRLRLRTALKGPHVTPRARHTLVPRPGHAPLVDRHRAGPRRDRVLRRAAG